MVTLAWWMIEITHEAINSAVLLQRSQFSPIYSHQTPHSLPARASYKVSVVSIKSGPCSAVVKSVLCVKSIWIGPRYNGTLPYLHWVKCWLVKPSTMLNLKMIILLISSKKTTSCKQLSRKQLTWDSHCYSCLWLFLFHVAWVSVSRTHGAYLSVNQAIIGSVGGLSPLALFTYMV